MKLRLLPLLLVASALGFAADGNNTSTQATASVQIVAPIGIQMVTNLCFGTIVVSPNHGTGAMVTIDPTTGKQTALLGPGLDLYTGHHAAPPCAASFAISGDEGAPFTFTIPNFLVTLQDGSSSMGVQPNYAVVGSLTTHATVPITITVGGVLGLDNAKPGVWSGTFNPQVSYS